MAIPDKPIVKTGQDLLYQIFIQHLTSREANLQETEEDFALGVAHEYLGQITEDHGVLSGKTEEIIEDLQAEVIEMLRKKIYGHFNLKSYRQGNQNDDRKRSTQ